MRCEFVLVRVVVEIKREPRGLLKQQPKKCLQPPPSSPLSSSPLTKSTSQDTRDDNATLWLRRTRECLTIPCPVLAPPSPPRSHSRRHGHTHGEEEEEEEEKEEEEGEEERHKHQHQQQSLDPPPPPVLLPGRHIEGRMLERRRRLEARRQVNEAEVARIMARRKCF